MDRTMHKLMLCLCALLMALTLPKSDASYHLLVADPDQLGASKVCTVIISASMFC